MVETLISSLKPIGNIVLICCAFFIIFGILGVQVRGAQAGQAVDQLQGRRRGSSILLSSPDPVLVDLGTQVALVEQPCPCQQGAPSPGRETNMAKMAECKAGWVNWIMGSKLHRNRGLGQGQCGEHPEGGDLCTVP